MEPLRITGHFWPPIGPSIASLDRSQGLLLSFLSLVHIAMHLVLALLVG